MQATLFNIYANFNYSQLLCFGRIFMISYHLISPKSFFNIIYVLYIINKSKCPIDYNFVLSFNSNGQSLELGLTDTNDKHEPLGEFNRKQLGIYHIRSIGAPNPAVLHLTSCYFLHTRQLVRNLRYLTV